MGQQVKDYLNTNALPLFVDEVMGGDELPLRFGDPLKDRGTPDIIVRPNYGTIYTGSMAKNAEHGGCNYSDTNVGLLVSIPGMHPASVGTRSPGSQVGSRGEELTRCPALGLARVSNCEVLQRRGINLEA